MFGKSQKLVAATVGAGALMMGSIAPAVAASQKYEECFNTGYEEICFTSRVAYSDVATSSGNYKFTSNGKYSYTITNNVTGQTYTSDGVYHYNTLFKKGELHVIHGRASDESNYDGQTCTFEYAYHYANGQWRYEDFDYSCV